MSNSNTFYICRLTSFNGGPLTAIFETLSMVVHYSSRALSPFSKIESSDSHYNCTNK